MENNNNALIVGVIKTNGQKRPYAVQVRCKNNVPVGGTDGRSKILIATAGKGGFTQKDLSARVNIQEAFAKEVFDEAFLATLSTDKFTELKTPLDATEFFGIPVGIKVTETSEPTYEGQQEKINPDTAVVLTSGGKSIYRNTEVLPVEECEPTMHTILVIDRELKAATGAAQLGNQ